MVGREERRDDEADAGGAGADRAQERARVAVEERRAVQADVEAVVRKGKPGTMMAPFGGVLGDAEIAAVARYVARFDPARSDVK